MRNSQTISFEKEKILNLFKLKRTMLEILPFQISKSTTEP